MEQIMDEFIKQFADGLCEKYGVKDIWGVETIMDNDWDNSGVAYDLGKLRGMLEMRDLIIAQKNYF